ncbi:YTH domain-containing protein ECT3-like isoform X3 [Hordeum vulgare subsp. vulgare]|uniref:YTH domain-containing family protein n=1 Tax=Hordeum vulgare subsp. vulgare TaxID=112509 RepID=A0A8I6YMY9_HORVV|nr:YTH domain-containing protein ECT3-like isoform X3 [Hordeum vulgare subsp. vulgare]
MALSGGDSSGFVDCTILLQSEIVVDNNPSKSTNTKEQIISITAEKTSASDARGSTSLKSPKGAQEKANFLGKGGEQPYVYQPNVYAPQPQTVYSGGYINPSGQWEEYPYYVSMEGVHSASPSIMLSPGYANNPQMMYGAYSPVSTVGEGDPMLQQEYFLPDGLLYSPTAVYRQPFGSYNRAATQPSNASGLFGQGNAPLAFGMQHGTMYNSGSYKAHQQASKYGGTTPNWGSAGRRFNNFDCNSSQQRGSMPFNIQNGALEFLNEQNRGPRAAKPKKQDRDNSLVDDKSEKTTLLIDSELYNRPDFATEYKDAIFFVIKSYTEDHVHRSIKYNVWASTASGNRKLDSAYRAAKQKEDHSRVFLFFSVNGSGQFCGVAEMIGPVDFDRSVDYWQQDKWSGQFPVKWHIIKDVPNTLLRHITLENNDNKPVTNSRDTQEVKLEYGLQMLSIFKNHEAETTIVEDFDFYEQREEALKENRRQQQPGSAESLKPTDAKAVGSSVTHIVDSFSRSVQLKEIEKSDKRTDGAISVNGSQTATVKAEKSTANKTTGSVEESS